jgi:hypothetical protein
MGLLRRLWHSGRHQYVLTPELIREGMSRDFVRQVQQLRKDAKSEHHRSHPIQYHSRMSS